MSLRRGSCQPSQTIAEFYAGMVALGPSNVFSRIGSQALDLLPRLEEALADIEVWGITSHEMLCLHNVDDYTAPTLVAVHPHSDSFEISYRLPEPLSPWPDAVVHGTATSTGQALSMIEIAIARSMGWPKRMPR